MEEAAVVRCAARQTGYKYTNCDRKTILQDDWLPPQIPSEFNVKWISNGENETVAIDWND